MAPLALRVSFVLSALFSAVSVARAETHTITFDNRCGYGTPTLILNGQIASTDPSYTQDGTINGIAYLQTGPCLFNGENCPLMELNLANPTCPGCGSSVDISLISPHAYTVETSFAYYDGCDGQGHDCDSADCYYAFHTPTDYWAQTQCEVDNVNLKITFCGDATSGSSSTPAPSSSASPSPSPASSSSRIIVPRVVLFRGTRNDADGVTLPVPSLSSSISKAPVTTHTASPVPVSSLSSSISKAPVTTHTAAPVPVPSLSSSVSKAPVTTHAVSSVAVPAPSPSPSSAPVTTAAYHQLHPHGNSAKCLDVRGNIQQNGTPVQIYDCNGTGAQNWVFSSGSTKVQLAGTDFCLDAGSYPGDGIGMKIWQCYDGLAAQQWDYTSANSLELGNLGLCLDLDNGVTANTNKVQTWHCGVGNTNQMWTI